MKDVSACLLVSGSPRYALTARQSIRSLLRHTDFDIFVGCGSCLTRWLPSNPRLKVAEVTTSQSRLGRAGPFLAKFDVMDACLRSGSHPYVLVMDADAVVGRPISQDMVQQALAGQGLGLVEQTSVRGSTTDRSALKAHYRNHTLAWFSIQAPPSKGFHYYNTGVILSKRAALRELVDWALGHLAGHCSTHLVGQHMIADQDYIQFWVHEKRPGICRRLPWYWNHCAHWDNGFPDPRALVHHLSFFCRAPRLHHVLLMSLIGSGHLRMARLVGTCMGGM